MGKAREGVAMMLNKVWHRVIDFGCVISRILWIKLKFSSIKICVVVRYGPNEGIDKKWRGSGMI